MANIFLQINSLDEDGDFLPDAPLNLWAKVDVVTPLNRGDTGNSITLDVYDEDEYVGYVAFWFMPEEQHTPGVANYIRADAELEQLGTEEKSNRVLSDDEKHKMIVSSMRRCGWVVEEDVEGKIFEKWVRFELVQEAQKRLDLP